MILTSERVVNLSASGFLVPMRHRRWQSLANADAGARVVRKTENSTAGRMDRRGMTGDGCESFAEILDSLDPGGWSGKFAAQSLKKGRLRRRGRSSFSGNHLPSGPIEFMSYVHFAYPFSFLLSGW